MSVTPRPSGWYADPWRQARWRYWTGDRWTRATSGVATAAERAAMALGPRVGDAVVSPWPPPPWPPPPAPSNDRRVDLPASAFGWGMLGLLVGLLASTAGGVTAAVLTDSYALEVACSTLGLWLGMVGAVVFCGKRYGVGRVRADYRVNFRGVDAAIGLGLSVAARIGSGIIVVVLLLLFGLDAESLPEQTRDVGSSTAALVVFVIIAVLGAPIVEELYFRGLLMRSLEPSLKPAGAIAVQAVIFGSLHYGGNDRWQQDLALVVALAAVGAALGLTAYISKRLSIGMWTHFFFNVVAAVVIVVDEAAITGLLR